MRPRKPVWSPADIVVATQQARRATGEAVPAFTPPVEEATPAVTRSRATTGRPRTGAPVEQPAAPEAVDAPVRHARIIKPATRRVATGHGTPTAEAVFGADRIATRADGALPERAAPTVASVFGAAPGDGPSVERNPFGAGSRDAATMRRRRLVAQGRTAPGQEATATTQSPGAGATADDAARPRTTARLSLPRRERTSDE